MSREELELLDKEAAGMLSTEERILLEERLKTDPSFREQVNAHKIFLKSLDDYDKRKALRHLLEEIHGDLHAPKIPAKKSASVRSLWPTIGIAASVALFCAAGTFLVTRLFDQKQEANYLELRGNVEQLKRSQKKILEDIKDDKKVTTVPGKYSGTGFLISSNGYVVTSYHVIRSFDSVYIENDKFGKLRTSVIYANKSNDIALLLISDNIKIKDPITTIRTRAGEIGEQVYTLGFPREEIVYGEGSISATSGYNQNEDSYQISVPVNPGNSGGPLFDQQGSVIGIVAGLQTQTNSTAYAIKSEALLKALQAIPADSLPKPLRLSTQNQISSLPRVSQVRRWKDYVFMVKVYKGG